MPIEPNAIATITVASMTSRGTPGRPLTGEQRPTAWRHEGAVQYGFVMADKARVIGVGETGTIAICFLSGDYAQSEFPAGCEAVFGEGPFVRGAFVLECWLCPEEQ